MPGIGGQQAPMRLPTELKRYYEGDLWSTFYFANAAALASTSNRLFSTPIGQQGQGFPAQLTQAETNLREAGRVPSGFAFTVKSVAVELKYDDNWGVVRTDILNTQMYGVVSWSFLNTDIEIAPIQLIGAGGGVFGSTADTGAADGGNGGSRTVLNNGAGQVWNYSSLAVLLPANTTFNLIAGFGAGATVVDGGANSSNLLLRLHLLGMTTTAVPVG